MRFAALIIFLIHFDVSGQHRNESSRHETLNRYIQEFSAIEGPGTPSAQVSNIIAALEGRKVSVNSNAFCSMLFQKVRQNFLKRYTQFATFHETVNGGRYNCLTGTALYALLLDYFGIEYSIIETNYHSFLLATTIEGTVLFEATDPIYGFVSDPKEVERRIRYYKQNVIEPDIKSKKYYEYTFELYKTVSLIETKGLMHYNLSIDAYNRQNFEASIHHLDKALEFYNSPRMHEFSSILLLAVANSNVEKQVKEDYLKRVQQTRKKRAAVMASRK